MNGVTGKWHPLLSQLVGGQKVMQQQAYTTPSSFMVRLRQQEVLVGSGYKENLSLESNPWEEN